MLMKFWNDESGVIISAELALVLTIAVLAMVVGLSELAVAVNTELNDLSNAVGALSQTYGYSGYNGTADAKTKFIYTGSYFLDVHDDCDDNTTCDIVGGIPAAVTCG